MRQIAVMGAGAMGSGIAQVAAMAGDEVLVYDPFPGAQLKAREGILQSLSKFSAKGKLTDAEVKAVFWQNSIY